MSALSNRVLVLNKSWTPIGTISVKRAIIVLFSYENNGEPKAKIVEPESYSQYTWEDWSQLRPKDGEDRIMSANMEFKVPEVIVLTKYDKFPKPRTQFSRRELYKRDNNTCMYCGCKPGTAELTIDHIIPKSRIRPGECATTWENTVLCCVSCNRKKANRTPEEAGMKLLCKPVKPKFSLIRGEVTKPLKSWTQFLGELYWQIPLQD